MTPSGWSDYMKFSILQRVSWWAFALVVLACAQNAGATRVALLIGNNEYQRAALDNPVNDARAMSEKLRKLGWETILLENGSRENMYAAFTRFGERISASSAEAALFFYAGHGMQVKGNNFLIPTDFVMKSEDDLPYQSVDLNALLEKLQSNKGTMNIIILDACRDDPFKQVRKRSSSSSGGLALVDVPVGTLIAFATSPGAVAADGSTGDHGTYTKHLLANIDQPGLKAEDVFKRVRSGVRQETKNQQIPWENSSLEGDLYFAGSANTAAVPARREGAAPPPGKTVAVASATGSRALELEFWNTVRESGSPMSYRAYLERYPDGEFAPLAKLKVTELQRSQQVLAAVVNPELQMPSPRSFGASVTHKSMASLDDQDKIALAGKEDAVKRLASTSCAGNKRKLGIRIRLQEKAVRSALGFEHTAFVDSLTTRLRSAGFTVGASAAYQLSGDVTVRVGNNRLLKLGELYVSSSLHLADRTGKELSSMLLYEEGYTGDNFAPALRDLLERQADEAVLRINQQLCGA
jgi:uncharacterized caspase-like protein